MRTLRAGSFDFRRLPIGPWVAILFTVSIEIAGLGEFAAQLTISDDANKVNVKCYALITEYQ